MVCTVTIFGIERRAAVNAGYEHVGPIECEELFNKLSKCQTPEKGSAL